MPEKKIKPWISVRRHRLTHKHNKRQQKSMVKYNGRCREIPTHPNFLRNLACTWLLTSDYLFFTQGCQQVGGVGGRKIMRRQGRNYLGQFPYSSSMLPAHNINLVPSIYRLLDSQLRLRYSLRQLNLFRQENWIRNIRLAKIYLQTNFVDVVEGYIFKNYQNYFRSFPLKRFVHFLVIPKKSFIMIIMIIIPTPAPIRQPL